jgi:hypothetical protein
LDSERRRLKSVLLTLSPDGCTFIRCAVAVVSI